MRGVIITIIIISFKKKKNQRVFSASYCLSCFPLNTGKTKQGAKEWGCEITHSVLILNVIYCFACLFKENVALKTKSLTKIIISYSKGFFPLLPHS